jgi:succinoglycan biosynthesis transport protein ExoP
MPDDATTQPVLTVRARPSRELEAVHAAALLGPPSGGGVAQRSVFTVVWRSRWLVFACVLLALAGGVVYLIRATPLYKSSSTLYIQQSTPKIVAEDVQGSAAALNLATQCELITSTAVLELAVAEPELADSPLLKRLDNPVGFLKSVVQAEPSKDAELITVSMTGPFPKDAAMVVNAVVHAYVDYQGRQHQSAAVQVAKILQAEMDSHKHDLETELAAMDKLRRENPQLMSRLDARAAGAASDPAQDLARARNRAATLHVAVSSAETAAKGPDPLPHLRQLIQLYQLGGLTRPSALDSLQAMWQQDQAALDHLRHAGVGPADQRVQVLQADLEQTQEKLVAAVQQEGTDCLETIRMAASAADDQARQLGVAYDADQATMAGLNGKAADYNELAAAADRNAKALDGLNDRLKDIRFTEDVGPMQISVVETAKPGTMPVSPVLAAVLGKALVVGLMAGLGVALLRDKLDQRLRSVEEIPSLLEGASILGVVPRLNRRLAPYELGRETSVRPRSGVAEAFRTVRTAIYFGSVDSTSVRTILVTSPTPGDGKSTTASNLAIAIAQAGRRVLLIDADCRRPVQHRTFGLKPGDGETTVGLGLTGVLTGRAVLANSIRPTGVDGLDLLPCGPLPPNPAELLDSQALLDLLAAAMAQYDQVVIDSPPINVVSDARILAASCNAVVMVVRAEQSTRRAAGLAWSALAAVGARRLGVVVNGVSEANGYDYYGYRGYGGYGGGYGRAESNGKSPAGVNGNGASAALGHRPSDPAEAVTSSADDDPVR